MPDNQQQFDISSLFPEQQQATVGKREIAATFLPALGGILASLLASKAFDFDAVEGIAGAIEGSTGALNTFMEQEQLRLDETTQRTTLQRLGQRMIDAGYNPAEVELWLGSQGKTQLTPPPTAADIAEAERKAREEADKREDRERRIAKEDREESGRVAAEKSARELIGSISDPGIRQATEAIFLNEGLTAAVNFANEASRGQDDTQPQPTAPSLTAGEALGQTREFAASGLPGIPSILATDPASGDSALVASAMQSHFEGAGVPPESLSTVSPVEAASIKEREVARLRLEKIFGPQEDKSEMGGFLKATGLAVEPKITQDFPTDLPIPRNLSPAVMLKHLETLWTMEGWADRMSFKDAFNDPNPEMMDYFRGKVIDTFGNDVYDKVLKLFLENLVGQ